MYYSITIPSSDAILAELQSDKQYYELMSKISLIGFLILAYLVRRVMVPRLKSARALWVDVVRCLPIVCMGERETVLLRRQTLFLEAILANKNNLSEISDEQR
jgi:hypothetical protein